MSEKDYLKKYLRELIDEVEKELDESTATGAVDGYQTPHAFSSKKHSQRRKKTATQAGYTIVDGDVENITEGRKSKTPVNRWLELKNDETKPNKKLAIGLKELKYKLREIEKFLSWYNKISKMNELSSDSYWKRTHRHIYKIKERLVNIAHTIKELEQ
jgi:hypothetical protein